MYKVGIGYDVHQLKAGESLILGGVDIEFDKGIDGHSDGDDGHGRSDRNHVLGDVGR